MSHASPKANPEATIELHLAELFDGGIPAADTADLVRGLAGQDGEARFGGNRSLWQLLEERHAPGLHWMEHERLDLLAELVRRLGREPRRPAARPIDSPEKAAALF